MLPVALPIEATLAAVSDPAIDAALTQIRDALLALLDGVSEPELGRRLADGEWSVREIILHAVHSERFLHPAMLELRRAVAPALPIPRTGGVTLPDTEAEASAAELRWALTAVREDTERLMSALAVEQLREPAEVDFGEDVFEMSLRTMAFTIADHQLFHLRQIERTLGRRAV